MCGIAGAVGQRSRHDLERAVRGITAALGHRGPDGYGHYAESFDAGRGGVALGHTRLAIIDPAAGNQPMHSPCGRLHLAFNGEIYNYRQLRRELERAGHAFRTHSDTEVLLYALLHWGADALGRLRGMFALAAWDSVQQTLLLARDRYGEKPLLYASVGGVLVFASELRALCRWPGFEARLDAEALPLFLLFRYAPAPLTLIDGVRKLMPGCFAIWRNGQLTQVRYYTPPDARASDREPPVPAGGPQQAAATFLAALDDSVASMMASDVAFGAFLSGGIDSSAIVALMTRHSAAPVQTFSVGFEEAGYSELAHAERVATHFRTDHHALIVRNDQVEALLADAVPARDAPVSEPADLPLLALARAARRSVKMVLTGEGSDEVLGGYPKHLLEGRIAAIQAIPAPLRRALLGPLLAALPFAARASPPRHWAPNASTRAWRAGSAPCRTSRSKRWSAGRRRSTAAPIRSSRRSPPRRCAVRCSSIRRAGCPTTCSSAATA
jgi:asparagine synthase (glutamine-hydrolysing)